MRDVNWGCLLFVALTIAVDAAAALVLRDAAAWLATAAGFAFPG